MSDHSPAHRSLIVRKAMFKARWLAWLTFAAFTTVPGHLPQSLHAETPPSEYETVSGTLKTLDLQGKTGTLTTDLGKQVAFIIVKPELFMNLTPLQRVTIKMDKEGRAIRVMDTAAPELPPPSLPK